MFRISSLKSVQNTPQMKKRLPQSEERPFVTHNKGASESQSVLGGRLPAEFELSLVSALDNIFPSVQNMYKYLHMTLLHAAWVRLASAVVFLWMMGLLPPWVWWDISRLRTHACRWLLIRFCGVMTFVPSSPGGSRDAENRDALLLRVHSSDLCNGQCCRCAFTRLRIELVLTLARQAVSQCLSQLHTPDLAPIMGMVRGRGGSEFRNPCVFIRRL